MSWINSKINLGRRAVLRHSIDEDITIENPSGPGMRIGGRWVAPSAATGTVTASVQPFDGERKEMLPEALRTREAIEVFSQDELRPMKRSEGKPPTLVHWRGNTYSVEVLEDFYELARYWRAVCSRVEQ